MLKGLVKSFDADSCQAKMNVVAEEKVLREERSSKSSYDVRGQAGKSASHLIRNPSSGP